MSIFKDVIDIVKDLGRTSSDVTDEFMKRKKYDSISSRAGQGTLTFPVIASRALDIETLQMISKALERDFGSFVQIAMSMSPTFDIKREVDIQGYLRKFHQNHTSKLTLNDVHNTLSDLAMEGSYAVDLMENGVVVASTVVEGNFGPLNKDNQKGLASLLEGINEDILNRKFQPVKERYVLTGDDNLNHYYNVKEASMRKPQTGKDGYDMGNGKVYKNGSVQPKGATDSAGKPLSLNITNNMSPAQPKVGGTSLGHYEYTLPREMLKDNDAKKANELVPTIMHMRVRGIDENGTVTDTIEFLLGIKTTLHPVSSEEMVNNIYAGLRNKGKFFNFIRFTSGEISFFKDFLLNLKDIRGDVSRQSAGSSRWWLALKRRANLAKVGKKLMLPGQFLPNASIVVSFDEVEYLKSTMGLDLMNYKTADRLMKEYFLLSIVVADTSSQIVHFLFDGQADFQSVTFDGLEKSTHGKNDMGFKDVLRLVQRV